MFRKTLLVTAVVLVAPILTMGSAPTRLAALAPQLSIATPQQVKLGQTIDIDVLLHDAPMVAGYEASVRFDKVAGEFAGVRFGSGSTGNVVTTVTSDPAGGVAYSAYTCLATGCPAPTLPAGGGALDRVQVRVEPLQEGRYTVSFEQLKFVDVQGRSVGVDVPVHAVTIDVGSANSSSPVFASPAVPFVLPPDGGAPSAAALDVTGNGDVTSGDANELASEWVDARRAGECSTPEASDPNGDGCLDIADLQLVGGTPAGARSAAVPGTAARINSVARLETVATPLVVNTINDLTDSNIGNGKCVTANGDCSLRAAIQEANASAGPDVISFSIPGAGVHTIQLGTQLPPITDGGLTIDGYTQPGSQPNTDPLVSNAIITVEVRGAGPTGFDAFKIVSAGNTIRGLAVYNVFNHFGIFGPGATGNVIAGDFIGSDAGSTLVFSDPSPKDGGTGVTMENGANHNAVGTPALADRNVIGGTPGRGIFIQHPNGNVNLVQNNLFGLKPHGDAGLRVGFSGIDIQFGAKNNQIGGPGLHEGNVISGVSNAAIDLSHDVDTDGNRVSNNFIGTTPAGNATALYTHNKYGVTVKDNAADNQVFDNVIGASTEYPVWVKVNTNGRNFFFNNHIGVALDGSPIPNAKFGMFLQGHDFQIGPGNVFGNNPLGGILVTSQNTTTGQPGADVTRRNRLTGNTFINNGGLAIDLSPTQLATGFGDGPTPNDGPGDADTGPNTLLNYPILDSGPSTTSVAGLACAACRVEIYKAVLSTTLNAGDRGHGQKFIGAATTGADGRFTAVVSGLAVNDTVAAITIDGVGNTSEFSPLTQVTTLGAPPPPGPAGGPPPRPAALASFVPLVPARLLDTRSGPEFATVDGQFEGGGLVGTVALAVTDRGPNPVPVGARAVALNVTVTDPVGAGFVTVYPCGSQRPLASSLNYVAGQTVPNAVIAEIGLENEVCLFASQGTHLVVDVTGYFPAGSMTPVVPARLLETRSGPGLDTADGQFKAIGPVQRDTTLELPVTGRGGGVPADAVGVVLNVTATEPVGPGFVTVFPCGGSRPLASNLNFVAGQTVPNLVITQVGVDGKVCLYANNTTHLVVDVSGYFAPDSPFGPLLPARLLETRKGPGLSTVDDLFNGIGQVGRGATVHLPVRVRGGVSATASAVVLNVTATEAAGPGYITVFPCDEAQPLASSLNYVAGQSVPNLVIAKVGADGTVCLFASEATHLVVDVEGDFPPIT